MGMESSVRFASVIQGLGLTPPTIRLFLKSSISLEKWSCTPRVAPSSKVGDPDSGWQLQPVLSNRTEARSGSKARGTMKRNCPVAPLSSRFRWQTKMSDAMCVGHLYLYIYSSI